jgi:hypothetical protein
MAPSARFGMIEAVNRDTDPTPLRQRVVAARRPHYLPGVMGEVFVRRARSVDCVLAE